LGWRKILIDKKNFLLLEEICGKRSQERPS